MTAHLPSLPALRAFAAVAREGSFVRAAETLHVSTSAISHQIRQLEEQLGTPLLSRARNGSGHSRTAPTDAGRELLLVVEETLDRLASACGAIRDRAGNARRNLVVSANGSFASLWLAPRLARFAALHPSVAWHMRAVESNVPDMAAEGLDLAILRARTGRVVPPDRLLFAETFFPICSPALAAIATPEELLCRSLLEEDGNSPEKNWSTWMPILGQKPGTGHVLRFSSYNQVIGAALAGAGLALGRSPLLDAELASGRLLRLFAPLSLPGSWAFVLRAGPDAARDPHVVQFCDFLLQEAGSLP
ncbi:LysR substrate-binding domain-containing protein [Roseomonas gilardii subsp. gilardii]|uniref:LysR substrate-binding domain-containing protein n=1 Tax=Roseomonas gilardii TaxID=257708 RepID=UPI001FF8BB63|nr:LysR substrate-binding domain-containing protein [Roseomonas gilardii]UPG73229.1 LysR substrate-binding domain-containing protein [Roseomonas gilardii subsp. gilardii]